MRGLDCVRRLNAPTPADAFINGFTLHRLNCRIPPEFLWLDIIRGTFLNKRGDSLVFRSRSKVIYNYIFISIKCVFKYRKYQY